MYEATVGAVLVDNWIYWVHTNMFSETIRNHPHQHVLVTRTKVKTPHKQQTNFSYMKQYWHQSRLTDYNSGERHTLVRVEYNYTKEAPNTNS
jgi:hypothetical protein